SRAECHTGRGLYKRPAVVGSQLTVPHRHPPERKDIVSRAPRQNGRPAHAGEQCRSRPQAPGAGVSSPRLKAQGGRTAERHGRLGDDPQPRRLHLVGRLAARLLFQTWIRILAPTTAMPTALVPPEPPATTTRVQPSRAARFRKTNLLPSNPSQSIALRRGTRASFLVTCRGKTLE